MPPVPLPRSKYRQVTLGTLLVLTTVAAILFAYVHLKRQQAIAIREANRVEFYAKVIKAQPDSFGDPMVKTVAADTSEPVARSAANLRQWRHGMSS